MVVPRLGVRLGVGQTPVHGKALLLGQRAFCGAHSTAHPLAQGPIDHLTNLMIDIVSMHLSPYPVNGKTLQVSDALARALLAYPHLTFRLSEVVLNLLRD